MSTEVGKLLPKHEKFSNFEQHKPFSYYSMNICQLIIQYKIYNSRPLQYDFDISQTQEAYTLNPRLRSTIE